MQLSDGLGNLPIQLTHERRQVTRGRAQRCVVTGERLDRIISTP